MKKLTEYIIENNNNYIIKEYHKSNPDEWKYISDHKSEIFDFMNSGYIAAGYKKFAGCDNDKSLKKNAILIKIAFYNSEHIAISIYTDYQKGNKCVGITTTTDVKYRDIGKEAVKEIIKHDCEHYTDFYWCECSGKVEHYYEKYNGIPIHNVYVNEFLTQPIELLNPDDTYHYKRLISGDMEQKIIYEFNTPEIFEKIYKECYDEINKYIHQMDSYYESLNESAKRTRYEICVGILVNFIDLNNEEGYREIPKEFIDVMKTNIEFLKTQTHEDGYTVNEYKYMSRLIEICEGYLEDEIFTPLELHKF